MMLLTGWIEECSKYMDEKEKESFLSDVKSFVKLRERAMEQKDTRSTIIWEKVKPISPHRLIQYSELSRNNDYLDNDGKGISSPIVPSSVVVIKLCGGLGTTMGLLGPKALVKVRLDKTFLDFAIEQTINSNEKFGVNIPLVLMTSFFTHDEIEKYISEHPLKEKIKIFTFQQKKFPRIYSESFLPISTDYSNPSYWCPPGHGDVYDSFLKSSAFKEYIEKQNNITHLFISNIDNLGAIVDLSIFHHVIENDIEFCLEVTKKTLNDVKGGTVIEIISDGEDNNKMKLLELAQVPIDHLNEFMSVEKFRIFNTNSMWISIKSLKENLSSFQPPIIFNQKTITIKMSNKKTKIIQLETACGAALETFKKVSVIQVPRIRRTTVKNCQDLFLAQSKLYEIIENGSIFIRKNKQQQQRTTVESLPIIRFFGDEWKDLKVYNQRISRFGIPDISKLKSLEVFGDVEFKSGDKLVLEGNVVFDGRNKRIVV